MVRVWRIIFAITWMAILVTVPAVALHQHDGASHPVVLRLPSDNAAATSRVDSTLAPATDPTTVPTTAAPTTDATTSTTRPAATTTVAPPTVAPTTVPRPAAPTTAAAPRVPPATAAPRPIVTAAPVTSGGGGGNARDFALIGYRWNPCHVITVTSSGPDVSGIVSELASITGLHFQMVSGTADITVQWGAVPPGGEIGLTAWRAVGGWLTQAGINISPQAQPYLATVLRHEMGHAVGLNHASQAGEVMYPTVGRNSPTDYSAGDLAGLHMVGASAGC